MPSDACTTHATPALDPARDLAVVHWPLTADTLLAYGVAAEASVGLMADRGAAGSAALLIGLADRMITLAADHAKERRRSARRRETSAVKHLLATPGSSSKFPPGHLPRRLVSGHGAAHGLP